MDKVDGSEGEISFRLISKAAYVLPVNIPPTMAMLTVMRIARS
jgi:hypothetical protein